MAIVHYHLEPDAKLTREMKRELKEAAKKPIVYDEDCPKLTDEQLQEFARVAKQQRAERTRVERTMSRTFNPGTVVVNGRRENFTEISKSPTNRYPDCKVVAQGIKSKMVYTPISIT